MSDRTIGYTTGVFDMFHIGHLRVLQRARENCDHLIVGVTSDQLCIERKQKAPIIPEWERMEIVKALKCVDQVVRETNLDKLVAWEELKFDRIFKGDDWKGSQLWNNYEKEFQLRNVEVVYFSYTVHTSSTLLRQKIDNEVQHRKE